MSKLFSLKAAFLPTYLTGLIQKNEIQIQEIIQYTKNLLLYVVENSIVFAGPNECVLKVIK